MTAKKALVKKPVTKKPVVKKEELNRVEVNKSLTSFPIIEIIEVKNFDINWFALSKKFKSNLKFIYDKKDDKINQIKEYKNPVVIPKIELPKINNTIKKYYECYLVIWDFYVNKNTSYDVNKRVKEILEYD